MARLRMLALSVLTPVNRYMDNRATGRSVLQHSMKAALFFICQFFLVSNILANSVFDLLERMNHAVRSLDYEGYFIYQVDDRLDSMFLVHRVHNGHEIERLVSLNGNAREVIRSGQAVACLNPGKEKIKLELKPGSSAFSSLGSINAGALQEFYRFTAVGDVRTAGRPAYLLHITPHDAYRFGYQLFIDKESALPLRAIMFDGSGQKLSQIMFTKLTVGPGTTPIEYDLTALQQAVRAQSDSTKDNLRMSAPSWSFNSVPEGFRLKVHRQRMDQGNQHPIEHYIFTDGLATVSVYIEQNPQNELDGHSRMGATQALSRAVGGRQVTAVGEVPLLTLQAFLTDVQLRQP